MIKYTGERIIPELMKPTNMMLLEHIARYQFAIYYAKGRLLDISCGVGYGSQIVAKAAKHNLDEVIGVDISEEAIEYARSRYYHPLINYLIADAEDTMLSNKLGQFDTIISFETLEHLHNDIQFIDNLATMLRKDGTLIISTPFGQGRNRPTKEPFHIHQLTRKEFNDLFNQFSSVEHYYQRGVLIEPPRGNMHHPIGIAVCRK